MERSIPRKTWKSGRFFKNCFVIILMINLKNRRSGHLQFLTLFQTKNIEFLTDLHREIVETKTATSDSV